LDATLDKSDRLPTTAGNRLQSDKEEDLPTSSRRGLPSLPEEGLPMSSGGGGLPEVENPNALPRLKVKVNRMWALPALPGFFYVAGQSRSMATRTWTTENSYLRLRSSINAMVVDYL